MRAVRDGRLDIEGGEDALGAGQGRLQLVVEHGDAAHGPEKVHNVDDESGQHADFQTPLDRQPAAQKRGRGDCDRHHGGEHRAEGGGDDVGGHSGLAIGGVDLKEFGEHLLLAGKGLDDPGAGDILLHDRVQRAEVALDGSEGGAAAARHLAGDVEHQRHQHEHRQRQLPVEQKHGHECAAQQQNIGDKLDQAVGQRAIDRLGVVRDPAHQIADLVAIVEGHRHDLHMVEETGADVGDKMLAQLHHDQALHGGGGAGGEVDGKDAHDQISQSDGVPGRDEQIDGAADQHRPVKPQHRADRHKQGNDQHLHAVGAQIGGHAQKGMAGVVRGLAREHAAAAKSEAHRLSLRWSNHCHRYVDSDYSFHRLGGSRLFEL